MLLSLKLQITLTGILNCYDQRISYLPKQFICHLSIKSNNHLMNIGVGFLKVKKNTLPTSLVHDLTTFANAWVAKTGFSLIFLSNHVNETHMAMHITTQNQDNVRNTQYVSCMENYKSVQKILTKNTLSQPQETLVVAYYK